MCAVLASFSSVGRADLSGSDNFTGAVDLELGQGHYAVFGKVVVANTDGEPRNARVRLRLSDHPDGPFSVLDESAVRLAPQGEADHLTVSVQWRAYVTGIERLDIGCATHRGTAGNARLTAVRIDFG